MSISKASHIEASDLTSLKDAIVKDLERRKLTATDITFTQEDKILATQVNTLIANLKKIDKSSWTSDMVAGNVIYANDVNTVVTKINTLSTLTGVGGSGGCSSGCTGLCYNACTSSCATSCGNNCSGGCSGGCSGSCSGSCDGTCSTACGISCGGNCYGGNCQGTCFSGLVEDYAGCNLR